MRLRSKALKGEYLFEKDLVFPLVSGTDVSRYRNLSERQFIIFPYEIKGDKAVLIPFDILEKKYPKTAAYLKKNVDRLENREKGKMKGSKWYGYIYLKNMTRQNLRKLCVPRLVENLCAAYDADGTHFLDNVDVGGLTLKKEYEKQGLPFILALLNSRLMRWFFPNVSAPFRGGWYSANRQFLSKVPIRLAMLTDKSEKIIHGQIEQLADTMQGLHKKLIETKTDQEKIVFQRQIDATDNEIDRLVYQLYGLTEEEIKVVENS